MMKRILCYGDSNTWGYEPLSGRRFDHMTRWPMVLWRLLNRGAPIFPEGEGEEAPYWVIEEGLCGRTSCREDPVEGDRNGLRQLLPILESHKPLDWVAVMLGSNDLKKRFNPTAFDVAAGVQRLANAVRDSRVGPQDGPPKVLMICPPPTAGSGAFAQIFGDTVELSKRMAPYFQALAKDSGVFFLDSGRVIKSSPADGLHLEPEEHRKLAEAVAEIVAG
ncbi:MAG: SGNH/GDSL hydrolase family protein [Treponema sp.]|jgi:lysophospholipase L1-like esterase|nr:SGNH/GDSL hydrolase family protein [Treponema sp.]